MAVATALIFANHWTSYVTSLLGGIGTGGLFIDEVGKLITKNNDYVFPLAFPVIYAFLNICIWLYFRVRRSAKHDSRALLYHSFENWKEILDNDLDGSEHTDLIQDLNLVKAPAEDPSKCDLATASRIHSRARGRTVGFADWYRRVGICPDGREPAEILF